MNFPSKHSQITKPKFFQVTSDIKNLSSYSKTCICNRALRTPQEKASRNILFYLLNIATNIDWHYSFKQTKLNKGKTQCLWTAGLKASFFSIIHEQWPIQGENRILFHLFHFKVDHKRVREWLQNEEFIGAIKLITRQNKSGRRTTHPITEQKMHEDFRRSSGEGESSKRYW